MFNQYKKTIFIILLIAAWIAVFVFIDAQSLVESIGTENGYLIASLIALIGGSSSFTSTSYIASIAYFSTTELNPFLLALFAGSALTIGDSIFYFLTRKGRDSFPESWDSSIKKVTKWLHEKPLIVVQILSFIYTGLTPFPGDLLMVLLSLSQYSFKKVYLAIWLGNISLVLIIYYLTKNGYQALGG